MPRRPPRTWWFLDDDLAHVLGYESRASMLECRSKSGLVVPVFKLRGRLCVDRLVVERFLRDLRWEQLELYEHYKAKMKRELGES